MLVSILNVCTEEELDEEAPFSEAQIGVAGTTTPSVSTSPRAKPPSAFSTETTGGMQTDLTLDEKRLALKNKIIAIGKMSIIIAWKGEY